jgi:hypothetical protein
VLYFVVPIIIGTTKEHKGQGDIIPEGHLMNTKIKSEEKAQKALILTLNQLDLLISHDFKSFRDSW